ncbi:MAG: TolC family protein [Aquificaceae bacterium]
MRSLFLLLVGFSLSLAITLQEAVDLALKNNISTKLSLLDIQKAEEGIKRARAGILPQVSFSYTYTRLGGDLAFGFTPKNRHSYLFEVDQTLFNSAVFESLKLSKEQRELQSLIYEDVRAEVSFQTKQLFYALLYKREVVRLLEENVKYWEENYKEVEAKFKAGILPKVELMRAKAQWEGSKAELESAKSDYQKSLEDFKRFIGYEGSMEPQGELRYVEYQEKDYEGLLLEKSTSIKVSRKSLDVLQRAIEVQKAQYYPSLEAFATYQGNTAKVENSEKMLDGYTFGIRLNYRIFDGFLREATIAQAKIDLLKQVESLKDVERGQRAELSKVLLDIKSIREQIRAAELNLEASKEALRLSTERYKYGIATQLEVLEAASNYNNALKNYYYLLYLYNTAIAKLERLTQ